MIMDILTQYGLVCLSSLLSVAIIRTLCMVVTHIQVITHFVISSTNDHHYVFL